MDFWFKSTEGWIDTWSHRWTDEGVDYIINGEELENLSVKIMLFVSLIWYFHTYTANVSNNAHWGSNII